MAEPLICRVCAKAYLSKASLTKHHKETHEHPLSYACTYCPKRFNQKMSLNIHLRRHTNNPLKCNVCSKTFSTQYTLQCHQWRWHAETQTCEGCQHKFASLEQLQTHRCRATAPPPNPVTPPLFHRFHQLQTELDELKAILILASFSVTS